jgi:hypothetical protein
MFLPLTLAATIAMLLPRIRGTKPGVALAVTCLLLAEFGYMLYVNRSYLRVERAGYAEAARFYRISPVWGRLERGITYCAVGWEPAAIILTGPTMSEFSIVERSRPDLCPAGTTLLRR